jgi:surface carbohydrate biosynthesis protein (TIGR04326 family)
MTSAAVDAYCTGIQVISFFRSDTLNLSPLRGIKGVRFVGTPNELKQALDKTFATSPRIHRKASIFRYDKNIPRWKKLFAINLRKKRKEKKRILCAY